MSEIDYRCVLSNEIIVDIDANCWQEVYSLATKLKSALILLNISHHTIYTGGRGLHIRFFFEISKEDMIRLTENSTTMRQVRMAIHAAICKVAKIPTHIIGAGKTIDTLPVSFGDDTEGWLIREIGGVKLDKVTRKRLGIAILLHEIPAEKPSTSNVENEELEFPDINAWKVPSTTITKIIAKTQRFKAIESTDIQIPLGEHVSLPCVVKCQKGLNKGNRALGAQIIAIACKCDKLNQNKAKEVAEAYFSRIEHDRISIVEIEQWFRWVYNKKEVFWDGRTCGLAQRLKLCDPRCKHRVSEGGTQCHSS